MRAEASTHSRPGKAEKGASRPRWPYVTSAWKRLRLAKLGRDPLCEFHLARGETVEATVVDHVIAIRQGGDPFPPLDRLSSLCVPCHSEKTARCDRGQANPTGRRFAGCDADGNPLDQADGWWSADAGEGASDHERSADGNRPLSQEHI
jgi:hypothetical protein